MPFSQCQLAGSEYFDKDCATKAPVPPRASNAASKMLLKFIRINGIELKIRISCGRGGLAYFSMLREVLPIICPSQKR